jgi:hypothetical protein
VSERVEGNGKLVSVAQARGYLDWLFEHVDWTSEPGLVSLLGIGEKGTPGEGKLRERKFIPAAPGAWDVEHLVRWAEWQGGAFVVPAVIAPAAAMAGDVTLDKIRAFTALLADLDSGDIEAQLEHLNRALGPPSMVVVSGGKTEAGLAKKHVYWRLTEPTADVDRVAALRKALAAKVGADQSMGRATQVIRIPGSLHCKNGQANPVGIVWINEQGPDYELDDLEESIDRMRPMPGIQLPAPEPSAGGALDFSAGAGRAANPVVEALTATVTEGGTEDQNRWLNFSRVAGLEIANARKGLQSLEEARELALGWMLAKMQPPWSEARFATEWKGLVNADLRSHGALPVPAAMSPPGLDSTDDLIGWSVHRRVSPSAPKRRILVEGLVFSGKRHMLVAEGGAGKTFLMMDLALKLAASDQIEGLTWMGQKITDAAKGGTVVLMTGEDDSEELDIRWHAIDPTGKMIRAAGDKLIALPLDNMGGAFPLAQAHPHTREVGPSPKWIALFHAMRGVVERGGRISAVIIDTLNATLHGEENSAQVIGEYIRAVAPVCGDLGAALVVTHHVRKPGSEPIKTLDDMREAIRGSTALPNAMRLVVGVWAAHDWEKRMSAMALRPVRGALFRAGVVKANMPEALREPRTLLRDDAGLLQDVTSRDRKSRGADAEAQAWMVWAIKRAADMRAPFARSGQNGVFSRRHQLPPVFHSMARDAELAPLLDGLLHHGQIILRPIDNGGKGHVYLDVPEAIGMPRFMDTSEGLDLKWRDFFYDHGWDEIRDRSGE